MPATTLTKFLNPWRFRREQARQRVNALRQRDGDACARCRRPLRFDLPAWHELAAKVEPIGPGDSDGGVANLCLTHGRCHAAGQDHTEEVIGRLRPAREAELLPKARTRRAA